MGGILWLGSGAGWYDSYKVSYNTQGKEARFSIMAADRKFLWVDIFVLCEMYEVFYLNAQHRP